MAETDHASSPSDGASNADLMLGNPKITTKSMFGSQPNSNRRTAPAFGFGSSGRVHYEKQYMGAEHAKVSVGHESPAPNAYTMNGSMGKQTSTKAKTGPQYVFGTQNRFQNARKARNSTPGPGAYHHALSLGIQSNSTKTSLPSYGFGSSNRTHTAKTFISAEHARSTNIDNSPGPNVYTPQTSFPKQPERSATAANIYATNRNSMFGTDNRFKYDNEKRAESYPGPGQYQNTVAVGIQTASIKPTMPSYGFGSAGRAHTSKVFVSAEHAKTTNIDTSPGPNVYTPASSVGKQALTRGHTSSSWGFGKQDRFSYVERGRNQTPGPGSYST